MVIGWLFCQVSDARAALAWLTAKLGEQARVLVWGHSLGSAVAAHMVADFDLETGGTRCIDTPYRLTFGLSSNNMFSSVSGLVLETPFSCMRDEVATFRAARALVWSGAVDLDAALAEAGARFETCKWLPAVRCPVLILAGGALVSTIY